MDRTRLIDHVRSRCGYDSDEDAKQAVRATLAVLGARLDPLHRDALARELPEDLKDALPEGDAEAFDLAAMFSRVASLRGITVPRAREDVTAVCESMGRFAGEETRAHLRVAFPPSFVELFERKGDEGEPPPHGAARVRPDTRQTLSTGKPGTSQPLNETPDAQPDSVAAGDPARSTRIATAQGLRQEQQGRTLASGKPGSTKSLGG